MKRLVSVLICSFLMFTFPAIALSAQTSPENPKFTLSLSAAKSEVHVGDNIEILIKITNISENALNIDFGYRGNVTKGYQYEVRDEQGEMVVKVGERYIQLPNGETLQLPTRHPGTARPGQLRPGESFTGSTRISDDYNFDHPGKYTIRVWKPATMGTPEKPELNRVYSNTITITVVAAGS